MENEGIYMLMSSWTKEGQDYAAGGHYGDVQTVVTGAGTDLFRGCGGGEIRATTG